MKAISPGKLILSGEHAVVYGKPAIAMAIDRSAQAVITPTASDLVSFNLANYSYEESFTLRAMRDLKKRVADNYHLFLNGSIGIREVMHKPVELMQYAFIMVLDGLHMKLENGVHVKLTSNIPIGCGLGSSAATVLSELRAIGHFLRVDFRPDWHYKYSLEAENLQHGRASGVDSYISLHGGCAKFRNGTADRLPLPGWPMFLVLTGTPSTTTGECVSEVGRRFGTSSIWDEFEGVTLELEKALACGNFDVLQAAVRENHRLLVKIGVVPDRVRSFIADAEASGAAAKVCGAGAVAGDAGGIVLVVSRDPPVDLCRKYGYEIVAVRGEPLGTRIIG